MKISKLNCTACGAPMSIPEDLDQITCASCGTGLVIERGEGYVALKLAEKIARTIEVSGIQTQDVIRENTQVTRTELQRLQLSQELSALQMQLNGIQTEIRLLQRDPNNKKFNSQLISLRGNEYQAMERIRVLKRQISVPDTENLRACIEVAEWECSWIGPELAALKSSNQPQKGRLQSELENRKNELNISIHGLKIREVRNRFVSFKRPDAPEADFAQTSALLAMINEDERKLHQLRNTPEGKAVHDEILRRQKAVKQTLNRLELERLSGTLRSVNLRPDPNDRTALVDYLNQLNSDIQSLSQVNSNDSARDFRSRLVSARKSTMRQLQILDNASRKANNPGCVAALFMGIAAGFTGLMAGIAQLFKTPSSQPGDTGLIQKSKLKPIRMATTLSVDSPPATQGQNDGKAFIGLGCFFWLLTFLGISAIGLVVFGLRNASREKVTEGERCLMGRCYRDKVHSWWVFLSIELRKITGFSRT